MPYIIIHSTNERVITSLTRIERGYKQNKKSGKIVNGERINGKFSKGHPDLIGYKIPNSSVKVLKDTPATRAYAASLLYKHPYETIVMFSKSQEFSDFDIQTQEYGKLMAEGKITMKNLKKKINPPEMKIPEQTMKIVNNINSKICMAEPAIHKN